jgi:hypothetical protein
MHYLIDGYNLLFRLKNERKSLQKKREEILLALSEKSEELKLHITIVFDATKEEFEGSTRGHFKDLEIVYTSKKQSADAYIIAMIECCKYPQKEIVVTSDRDLARHCAALGARSLSIEAFFKMLQSKKKKQKRATSTPKVFKESDSNFARLLKIFEERLKNDIP